MYPTQIIFFSSRKWLSSKFVSCTNALALSAMLYDTFSLLPIQLLLERPCLHCVTMSHSVQRTGFHIKGGFSGCEDIQVQYLAPNIICQQNKLMAFVLFVFPKVLSVLYSLKVALCYQPVICQKTMAAD